MLSGLRTKGKSACPHCVEDTKAFTFKFGGKSSWFDCHRQFLSMDHPFRRRKRRFMKNKIELYWSSYFLNQEQLWKFIKDFPKVIVHLILYRLRPYDRFEVQHPVNTDRDHYTQADD